jgi:hypothetical protein
MDFNGVTPYDQLTEKWSPVLDHQAMPEIEDGYRRKVTAALLENQESALREQSLNEAPSSLNHAGSGGLAGVDGSQRPLGGYDPILISLVRRAMPNLMAYDVCGVQPMSAPTGLIFALKSQFSGADRNNEALFAEAGNFGGTGGATAATNFDPLLGVTAGDVSIGRPMSRDSAEALGENDSFAAMAFSIERSTARSFAPSTVLRNLVPSKKI